MATGRYDARAGTQLAAKLRLQIAVDAGREVERHDGRRRDVGGEQISLYEGDLVVQVHFPNDLARRADELGIELDADAARAVFLRREHDVATVSGAEIVHDVAARDLGQLQHLIHDRLFGGTKKISAGEPAGATARLSVCGFERTSITQSAQSRANASALPHAGASCLPRRRPPLTETIWMLAT